MYQVQFSILDGRVHASASLHTSTLKFVAEYQDNIYYTGDVYLKQ